MKIKDKKPFGEKHRLRRAKLQQQRERQSERHRKQLEKHAWYQRIQALKPDDACEYFAYPEWRPAVFVRQEFLSWEVRDEQGRLLRVGYPRHPGDQEAWWELGSHDELDRKFVQGFDVEVLA